MVTSTVEQMKPVQKHRHILLTILLIVLILANILGEIINIGALFTLDIGSFAIFGIYSMFFVLHLTCLIALFGWKRWGFWGYCAASCAAFIARLAMGWGPEALVQLVLPALLFITLQLGGAKKAWNQLD